MSRHPSSTRGKWLAAVLIALGLAAAVAGLKFRVLEPAGTTAPASL